MSDTNFLTTVTKSHKKTVIKLFQLTSLSCALALAGCGGGGGTVDSIDPKPDLGLTGGNSGNTGTSDSVQAKAIYLATNYSGIKLEKGASIEVTAQVLDKSNGVISGQPVKFNITNPSLTGVFSKSSSEVVTNDKGEAVISLEVQNPLTNEQKEYLKTTGLTVEASVGKTTTSKNIKGTDDNVDIQKKDIYDVFISSTKSELLTGKSSATIDVRVTDKNGGVISGVPVILSIKDAAKYGLSLDGSSKQTTNEKGLVQIDLQQNPNNIDAQLDHQTMLVVKVDDGKNSLVEQTMPIYVTGTKVSNVKSSKSVVSNGENFSISGSIVNGASDPIAKAAVKLLNGDKVVGTGTTNTKGEFIFDLNSSSLQVSDEGYVFNLQVEGESVNQNIADIIQVATISSSNMSFSQVNDIVVNNFQQVVLNVPNASNGDTVYISTNKGKLYDNNKGTGGSSRHGFEVNNKKVVFYVNSSVPGKATLKAEYKQEIKESSLSFVSVTPNKLLLQVSNSVLSVGGTTSVVARVLDKNDAPVKNAIVQFTTTKDASGGELNQGVAYTDEGGVARVTYTAGQNPTSSDGVVIEAQVQSIRLPDGEEKAVNQLLDVAKVSVQTKSSFISFAFSDKLVNGDRNIYYYLQGSVNVLNSAGKPAINQPVSINLIPYDYEKGYFTRERLKLTEDGEVSSYRLVWKQVAVQCPGEDKNDNSILDNGEDVNNNGQLDPINVAAILTTSGELVSSNKDFNFVTDETGKVNFQIRYPKEYANWYRAKITVNTRVDGSESQQSRIIGFPVLSDDVDIEKPLRPNTISPFGTNLSCTSSN